MRPMYAKWSILIQDCTELVLDHLESDELVDNEAVRLSLTYHDPAPSTSISQTVNFAQKGLPEKR